MNPQRFLSLPALPPTGGSSRFFVVLLLLSLLASRSATAQNPDCAACTVFPSLTIYQVVQSGNGIGLGFEGGNWRKTPGKFSYFLGSSMVWQQGRAGDKNGATAERPVLMTLYVKGQYAIASRFYAEVQPGLQDLSLFTLRAGLRYVVPLSNRVGVGLEPAYSIFQDRWTVNTNVHIALK